MLAEAFLALGQPQYASDSLAMALSDAAMRASPILWLLAGRAAIQNGHADAAEAAFIEANLLDPELPDPWGWLALLASR